MVDVSFYRHLDALGESLENALNLMVLVCSRRLDGEVHLRRVAKTLEEVHEHLRRHVTYALASKLRVPLQPCASAKVESHLAQAVVHGQTVAVAFDAAFVAKRLEKTFAKHNRRVFDGVVLVNVQVALGVDRKVAHAVASDLLKHVVKESEPCAYVTLACAVEVQLHEHVGLLCCATHLYRAFASKEQLRNLVPRQSVAS